MKTIRIKDQSTQTTPSLTTRPPFRRFVQHSTPIETPEQVKDLYHDDAIPKSSNLILEPSKTPINFEESSSPHFKLSVDETPKKRAKPKSRVKLTVTGISQQKNSPKRLKLSSTESAYISISPPDHQLEKRASEISTQEFHQHHESEKSDIVLEPNQSDKILVLDSVADSNKTAKKRGRPKKSEASNKESTSKADTIPSRHISKKETKIPKSEPAAKRKSMKNHIETPVTTNKSSISVSKINVVTEEEKPDNSPKTPRSPNTRRQKLHKQRENLMKKIEKVELELEGYHNPNPSLRRSLRIREKMVINLQNKIAMLMNLVHFVERQDEILMRQQRKYKEKSESLIKRPIGRRIKKLKVVSDEEFSSN